MSDEENTQTHTYNELATVHTILKLLGFFYPRFDLLSYIYIAR